MDPLAAAVSEHLGGDLASSHPLHGGDLSEVRQVTLADGRKLVAKLGPLVGREARMLEAMRAAGAPVPRVLGVSGTVMLMQALEENSAGPAGWEALGRGLRTLHGLTCAHYGWDEDYAFGPVAIPNTPTDDWPTFWAERRLMADPAAVPADIARRVEALARRLPDLLPKTPPAALLHGDLWSGNALFSGDKAYLIDPACYYGHGEVDLAMLNLFGSPGPGFERGYGPIEPDLRDRRPIYQLWPALVHLRLFGSGYRMMVETRLSAAGV